jgi:nicotinamide-nucleotide amidase
MKAEIITIGDEMLIGQIVDTNSAWMAGELNKIGVGVTQITTISDTPVDLVNALDDAQLRADVILITGGLGPTKDDRTKKVLAEYFNSELITHQPTLYHVTAFFKKRGLGVNQLNKDQALVPECCEVLHNPAGTAPGMLFEHNDKIFVSMPGVPFEMKEIMQTAVLPGLKDKNGGGVIVHKTVHTIGIPESILAERLEEWENALPEYIHLAYLPNPGQIRLRFSAFGNDEAQLKKSIEAEIVKLKKMIPEAIFGYDNDTLAGVVGKLLVGKKTTVATAESCTGGQIAHSITSDPGCSDWFKGSVVAYANEVKIGVLNVEEKDIEEYGAVSEQVVKQMAERVRENLNADYSVATSGIAGPTGGTADKPVGTVWIAVASPNETIARKYSFSHNRERNIIRSSQTALNMLRLVLVDE